MFTELMPLLQNRPLTITVAPIGDQRIRVNVIPQATEKDKQANSQIGHTHSKEVAPIPDKAMKGLTTPLCLTGTPAEIDAALVHTLNNFTSLHVSLQQSFDTAATAIGASVKAIDDRERIKKEADKAKKTTTSKAEQPKKQAAEPALPSLFTTAGQSAPAAVSASDAARNGSTKPDLPASSQSAAAPAQTETEQIHEGDEDDLPGEDEREE
jgi:PRTRC genetic system protein E